MNLRATTTVVAGSLALLLCGCAANEPARTAPEPKTGAAASATLSNPAASPNPYPLPAELGPDERLVTILGTNDMHGGAEMTPEGFGPRRGQLLGGLAVWSGIAAAIREGLARRYGDRSGVLLLDAGDQFQGTLLSNFDQGLLLYDAMNFLRYDAAIPGNHGFDFGPVSTMDTRTGDVTVTDPLGPDNRLGALTRLAAAADFPLLSANTYLRSSLADAAGAAVEVEQVGCRPTAEGVEIDWSRARRPPIFRPYAVREVAGLRAAIVGIDHHETALTTTAANVRDLCFRGEVETYEEVRRELEGQADLFVLVIHNGDSNTDFELSEIAGALAGGDRDLVDAVVAGHTHYTNNVLASGVAAMQSGSGTSRFGRIDLIWNDASRRVDKTKTRFRGGIPMWPDACDAAAEGFCEVRDASSGTVQEHEVRIAYEGVPVVPDPRVVARIGEARRTLAALADRVLGTAEARLTSDRISESPLADRMTDAMLAAAGTAEIDGKPAGVEISVINTGGLRAPIERGEVTYEELFAVMPFDNEIAVVECSGDTLVKLMGLSADRCGRHGAIIPAGLVVEFERRDCSIDPGPDNASRLVSVRTRGGAELFPEPADAGRTFRVATLDFLATGGSGYGDFASCAPVGSLGPIRQVLVHHFLDHPFRWDASTDGRFRQVNAENGD